MYTDLDIEILNCKHECIFIILDVYNLKTFDAN